MTEIEETLAYLNYQKNPTPENRNKWQEIQKIKKLQYEQEENNRENEETCKKITEKNEYNNEKFVEKKIEQNNTDNIEKKIDSCDKTNALNKTKWIYNIDITEYDITTAISTLAACEELEKKLNINFGTIVLKYEREKYEFDNADDAIRWLTQNANEHLNENTHTMENQQAKQNIREEKINNILHKTLIEGGNKIYLAYRETEESYYYLGRCKGEWIDGLCIPKINLVDLADVLYEAIRKTKSKNPYYTYNNSLLKAKIYNDFGSLFVEQNSENWATKVTYTDWGNGAKYDIRKWYKKFERCGKGVTLNEEQTINLIRIIDDMFEHRRFNDKFDEESITYEAYEDEAEYKDFFLRSYVLKCAFNHNVKSVSALVPVCTVEGKIEKRKIPAVYCNKCQKYIILEKDYYDLKDYGVPLFGSIPIEEYPKTQAIGDLKLREKGILAGLNYSVSEKDDYTEKQRRAILISAVENNIIDIPRIVSYLDFFIAYHPQEKYKNAVEKWTEDRKFINQYRIEGREVYMVKAIRR